MTKYLALLCLAACGADVPANPTYFADVQPILAANCVRCHGAVPAEPAIARFRLDRYVKGDASTYDVYDYATGSPPALTRVAVDLESPVMPPDYLLTARQQEILARWVSQGAPKGTRDNQLPQIELLAPMGTSTADQTLDTTFRAWDADRDGLVVQLWAHDVTTNDDIAIGAQTGGGQHSVSIDTGTLASKHTFEIYAVLDDGFFDDPARNKVRVPLIPEVLVDHGIRGTAPTVRLLTPNGGDTLYGTTQITWTATDPDVDMTGSPDVLTISIVLARYDVNGVELGVEPIANDLPNSGSFPWTIPAGLVTRDGSGNPIPYKVRITATDTLGIPRNFRSDESDFFFFIEQATTTTWTWADIEPLTVKYCSDCHGEPARTIAIDNSCFLQYQQGEAVPPCAASDLGVFEQRSLVYQRVVSLRNMPPANAPQPTQAERDKIGNWLLGGAPYGSGPADERPTLTWTAPSASAVLDASASGTATLQWTVADAEGLLADRIEYAKVNGPPSCNLATPCGQLIVATWNLVTMNSLTGTSAMQMYAWPRPAEGVGCYCVRGIVTDSAMQPTIVVAAKPVRF